MTAHGTDPATVDEETFTDICIMYVDGVIGNLGLLETLGCLTGAVYNYMRKDGQAAFKLQDIIRRGYDYIYPPLSDEEKARQVNNALLAYMQQSPNAPQVLFRE